MNNPNRNKSDPRPQKAQGGLIKQRESWRDAWAKLKKYYVGSRQDLTELEKHLVTNDNEALALDPLELTYVPSAVPEEFKPQITSSKGHSYLNTTMGSYYLDGDIEEALTGREANKTITSRRPLARVSLMMSHMERCYAEEVVNKEKQDILALEIYRTLLTNNQ